MKKRILIAMLAIIVSLTLAITLKTVANHADNSLDVNLEALATVENSYTCIRQQASSGSIRHCVICIGKYPNYKCERHTAYVGELESPCVYAD